MITTLYILAVILIACIKVNLVLSESQNLQHDNFQEERDWF